MIKNKTLVSHLDFVLCKLNVYTKEYSVQICLCGRIPQ